MQGQIILPGAGLAAIGTKQRGRLHLSTRARRRAYLSDLDREIRAMAKARGWQATKEGFAITSDDRAHLEQRAQELRIHWRLE